ncbi:MAG: class I SAM-dependent methyltransferase, partial [Planctomycetota bacterium]
MTKSLYGMFLGLLLLAETACGGDRLAATVYEQAGLDGGLVVELGVKDVDFTAALGRPEAVTLQALDTDPRRVAEARQQLEAKGLYGPISVARFDGKNMPYADNLVNMVVTHDREIPQEEIFRVLVPGGVLCTLEQQEPKNPRISRKPW